MSAAITSISAYRDLENSGKAGSDRAKILKYLIDNDREQGFSRKELSRRLGMEVNAVSGRCNELLNKDLIDNTDSKVCTVSGKYVEALRILV